MTTPATDTPKAQPRARITHVPDPVRTRADTRTDAHDKRRSGLIPLYIGAARVMKGRDGVKRLYVAREMRVEAERAQRDGRTLTAVPVCFDCERVYTSDEEFKADHAQTSAQYAENHEIHTHAYWCEDKYDAKSVETLTGLTAEIKALESALHDAHAKMAKCENIEAIMSERERAEKVKGMLADARARKKVEDENIIGLLSDTPQTA